MLSGVGPAPHRKRPSAIPPLSLKTRSMFNERRRANVRCSMLLGKNFLQTMTPSGSFEFICLVEQAISRLARIHQQDLGTVFVV
jgi:hypothetical protein